MGDRGLTRWRRCAGARAGTAKLGANAPASPERRSIRTEDYQTASDRFRGILRGGLGGEERAEPTRVGEHAPQTASADRGMDRKLDDAV